MNLPKTIPKVKPTEEQAAYIDKIASWRVIDPKKLAKIRIGGPKPKGFYEGR